MKTEENIMYLHQSISVAKHRLMDEIEKQVSEIKYYESEKENQLKKLRSTIKYLQSLIQVLRSIQNNDMLNEVKATVCYTSYADDPEVKISLFGHN